MDVSILETRDTKNRFKSNAGFNERRNPEYQKKSLRSEHGTKKFNLLMTPGRVTRGTLIQSEQKNYFPRNKKKAIKTS